MKIARVIANFNHSDKICRQHLSEAIQFVTGKLMREDTFNSSSVYEEEDLSDFMHL